jgi:cellulose synthase operon protein C
VTERCDDLDLFFDRELEPEVEQAYRDHLATCTRCQEVLLGRMLEAAVVSEDRNSRPSIDPIPTLSVDGPPPPEPASQPPTGSLEPPDGTTRLDRRRVLLVAAAILPAAAAAVLVLWPPTPTPSAPARPDDVAIRLTPERVVDVRFTAAELDRYRKRSVMRAAGAAPVDRTEQISLEALGALKQRAEKNALVGAFALNGDLSSAMRTAGELSRSAASLTDRAAVVLLQAETTDDPARIVRPAGPAWSASPAQVAAAETAVSLTSDALRLDPRSAQAKWNQAIALRRLGLSLTAARVFDDVAALHEVGWSDEARESAQRLRDEHREAVEDWQRIQTAADAMIAGGPAPGDEDIRRAPSFWRDQFYVALATASTADRFAALAPLAHALDAQFATTAPSDLLARVRASDLRARAPVAAELHDFIAHQKSPSMIPGLRDRALQRGAPDVARASFLLVPELLTDDGDLAVLDRLLAGNRDDWWRLIALARRAYVTEFRHRDYAAVDAIERLAEPLCKAHRNAWCGRITLLAGGASSQMGRADLAIEQLTAARYQTGAAPRDEADAIEQLGQAIAIQVTDAIDSAAVAGAYLEEVALRRVTWCRPELHRLDFAAMAALQRHRIDEAARFRDQADLLEQGKCREIAPRLNGEIVRFRLLLGGRGSLATLRDKLSRIRSEGWQSALPYADFLDAAATLVEDRPRGEAALRQAITRADADPSQSYAAQIRGSAFDALVESAAESRDPDAVLALLAERLRAPRLDRCVLGVASWNRLVVAVLGADGKAVVDRRAIDAGVVMVPPAEVVAPALRARLNGCRRVEVLAPAPYFGAPRLLDDRIAWVYHSGIARTARELPPRHEREIVVSGVTPPDDLHLPALSPFPAGPAAEVLSGARATPANVLAAMATASLAVVVAHGITDAQEPTAASLILSPDAQGDHLLTAAKVRAAKFSGAPVVVLAGCYAGRVQVSAEPWSLATSFIEAGARVVIAPTEPIPDASATAVFQALVEQIRAGVDPVDAVVAERTAPGTAAAWLSSIVIFD